MVGSWLIQRGSCYTFWIPSPKGILKKLEGFQAPILRIRLGVPKITSKLGTVTESRRLAPTDLQAMEQLRTRLRVVGKPPPFFCRHVLSKTAKSAVLQCCDYCQRWMLRPFGPIQWVHSKSFFSGPGVQLLFHSWSPIQNEISSHVYAG